MSESPHFQLPQKGTEIRDTFDRLCEWHPPEAIPRIMELVMDIEEKVKNDSKNYKPHEIALADKIAKCCYMLLASYANYSKDQQTMIIGAVRYYACHLDSISDSTPGLGFKDDALVMNCVLKELGVEGHFLKM